jgi:hypothetical protein
MHDTQFGLKCMIYRDMYDINVHFGSHSMLLNCSGEESSRSALSGSCLFFIHITCHPSVFLQAFEGECVDAQRTGKMHRS